MKIKSLGTNKTQVTLDNGTEILYSYETPVAAKIDDKYFRTEKKWSVTTSKHINQWIPVSCDPILMPQCFFDAILIRL